MLRTLRHVRGRCANEGRRDSGQHLEGVERGEREERERKEEGKERGVAVLMLSLSRGCRRQLLIKLVVAK